MNEIKRIKKLMSINEQEQKPVTAPLKIKNLILLLNYVHKIEPEWIESVESYNDVDFTESVRFSNELGESIIKNAKLFGISDSLDEDTLDFVSAFILENKERILNNNLNETDYIIPKLKKFEIVAEEEYVGRKTDTYKLTESAYNKEYIVKLIERFTIDVADGTFIDETWDDTWDNRQDVIEINEIPVTGNKINEEVDLDNYEAPFSAEDFTNYVNSEFDLETLELMKGVLQKRINFLNTLIGTAKRTEITGFKRFDK